MPGSPQKRARTEQAKANGEVTTPEVELNVNGNPVGSTKRGATAERMRELTRIRMEKQARGEIPTGRPRTKFTRAEVVDHALAQLEPKALKVLREQLDDPDQRVRQSAAVKILEYKRGKPTQQIKSQVDQRITAIRFETAALAGASDFSDVLEVEPEDEEPLALDPPS